MNCAKSRNCVFWWRSCFQRSLVNVPHRAVALGRSWRCRWTLALLFSRFSFRTLTWKKGLERPFWIPSVIQFETVSVGSVCHGKWGGLGVKGTLLLTFFKLFFFGMLLANVGGDFTGYKSDTHSKRNKVIIYIIQRLVQTKHSDRIRGIQCWYTVHRLRMVLKQRY